MTDLNLGATVTDGGGQRTFLNPANANDGNDATAAQRTSYVVASLPSESILESDLGAAFEVDVVTVLGGAGATGTNNVAASWKLEHSSDGSSWTESTTTLNFGSEGGRGLTTITLAVPTTDRYWRITFIAGGFGFLQNLWVNRWTINEAAATPEPPIANFVGTPLVGGAPLEVEFTDLSQNTPTSWSWDFGDGVGTSTDQNPTYEYANPGSYTVELVATNAEGDDTETKVAYVTVSAVTFPFPGVFLDFTTAGFDTGEHDNVTSATHALRFNRGTSGEVTGSGGSGGGTLVLVDPDGRYNPTNAAGPLFGLLRDGIRLWAGCNTDGTITYDAGKTVKGLCVGRVTDITPIPSPGTGDPATVEFTFEDPLAWIGRASVQLPDSRTRSQEQLRGEVLSALGEVTTGLCEEPTTMPLSGADGLAGNVLEAINKANGTRHFANPADNAADWYAYTTVRRTSKLDGVADATLSATSDHVTGMDGWRTNADTVINQQRATVEPVEFTIGRPIVWEAPDVPFTLTDDRVFWVDFDDFVDGPVADVAATGDVVTALLEPFGATAKLTLSSAGTSTIASVTVQGNLARRGLTESYVVDDLASQAPPRGVRAGPDLSGDLLGIGVSAYGMAAHLVWRFADPKLRPTLTAENWFPEMTERDLFDLVGFTSTHLSVSGRLFEIVGLDYELNIAALTVVHHVVTYQLQESRVQSAFDWFVLDVSETDGDHVMAY